MSTAEEKSIEKSSSYGISIQSNSLLSLTLQKQKKMEEQNSYCC